MVLTAEERAAQVLESFEGSETLRGLEALIASIIREAVEEERRGIRTTLGLCIQVFDRVLDLAGLPGDLRATMRACRGLCLAGRAESEAVSPPANGGP